MRVTETRDLDLRVPEVAVFTVDEMPGTHLEWRSEIEHLDLNQVMGWVAAVGTILPANEVSYPMVRVPEEGKTRDWWAADHSWHIDGARWPEQPAFTVIGCQQADEGAPGTQILDAAKLLDITTEDGFWAHHRLDPRTLTAIFQDSTYHREFVPAVRERMTEEELAALDENIAKDLAKDGSDTLEEYLAKMDARYPAKRFDFVRPSPLSGTPSLFFDEGSRNSKLIGQGGEDHTDVLHQLRHEYLEGVIPDQAGIVRTTTWVPKQAVIFPQVGTLHRAQPGNDHNRSLHLGFLNSSNQSL